MPTMTGVGGAGLLMWRYDQRLSLLAPEAPGTPRIVSLVEYSDAGVRQGDRYIMQVDKPKVDALRKRYAEVYVE